MIKEKKLAVRDTMTIEIGGREAKVKKRLIGIRDRYNVDFDEGDDYTAKGNFVDHEYEIEREGEKVAEISKKWFRVRDTYGVEIEGEQDVALILAITVCIDAMSHDLGDLTPQEPQPESKGRPCSTNGTASATRALTRSSPHRTSRWSSRSISCLSMSRIRVTPFGWWPTS